MAATTLQGRRAMSIYASDTIDIPNINNLYLVGSQTAITTNKLTASAGNFINNGVKVGDIVYNANTSANNTWPLLGVATVIAVDSATALSLSADIFTTGSNEYRIFRAVQNGGDINPGCLLMGTNTTLASFYQARIRTIGNDNVTIATVASSDLIPIQVIRLFASGTTTNMYGTFTAIW
jgi:hypothetical protein